MSLIKEELGVIMQVYWETDWMEGFDRDVPITLTLNNKPILVVLERIIEQLGIDEDSTWQLRDGVLEVGFKSRFTRKSSQQLKVYPIDDLLFVVRDFDNAPDMGTGTGGGSGGSGSGGSGGGGSGVGGGSGGIGGGGGSGGSGGGGGGGITFGSPSADPERLTKQERIDRIIELIMKIR